MTGFGMGNSTHRDWSIEVTVKTLNHRGLDLHIMMPGRVGNLELLFQKLVKQHIGRGRVDIEVSLKRFGQAGAGLNMALFEKRVEMLETLFDGDWSRKKCMEFCLGQRDVWERDDGETLSEEFLEIVLETTRVALESLNNQRRREGKLLKEYMLNAIDSIETSRQTMTVRSPFRVSEYRQRLEERLASLNAQTGIAPDERQLAYEVALIADKFDITEELTRIGAHLSALRILILSTSDPLTSIGKKIDFYLQELNREVTTIASKSRDTILTRHTIDVRTTLESMREQVSNIQ